MFPRRERMSTALATNKLGAIQPFMRLQSTNRCSQRPRKHANGKKLWMKNPQGIKEWMVTIVSATYNSTSHRWEYTMKDKDDEPIKGTVKERDLAG